MKEKNNGNGTENIEVKKKREGKMAKGEKRKHRKERTKKTRKALNDQQSHFHKRDCILN